MAKRGGRVWISACAVQSLEFGVWGFNFLIWYAEFGVGIRLLGSGSKF